MNYLYDKTFQGFLTCVHAHYYLEKADGIFPSEQYQQNLLLDSCIVNTDEEKAGVVFQALVQKVSAWDAERVYRAFCTESEDKEMRLLRYIRLGFKRGASIRLLHSHETVLDVQKMEQKLGSEVHRLCGLIRFSTVDGNVLFAKVSPDHDVLEFLASHFCERFKNDPFLIWDERREKALVAFQKKWYITNLPAETICKDAAFRPSEEELSYRVLWKRYFDTIAIRERTNARCQKSFMPVRYWSNLPEMKVNTTNL